MISAPNHDDPARPDSALSTFRWGRWVIERGAGVVLVMAAATRLLYWFHVRAADPFYAQVFPPFDMDTYWTWAQSITAGDWLSRDFTQGGPFFYGPLYPYFLALVFSVFGENFDAVHGIQALVGLLPPILVWSLARRLFGKTEALVAGLLAAGFPLSLFYEQLLLMEGLLVALHAAMLVCLVRGSESPRRGWLWMAAAGALAGAACWGRGNLILVLPALGAFCLWTPSLHTEEKERAESQKLPGSETPSTNLLGRLWPTRSGVVLAAGFCLGVLLPFALAVSRNATVSGRWAFTTAHGALNLYRGNAYDAPGVLGEHPSFDALVRQYGSWYDVPWGQELVKSLRQHPGAFVRLLLAKIGMVVNSYDIADNANYYACSRFSWLLKGNPLGWGLLVPLAAIGLWRARTQWRRQVALYAYAVGFAVSVVLVFATGRYRLPLEVPITVWAGCGVVAMGRDLRERQVRTFARQLGVILALVVILWPWWSPGLRFNQPDAPWWKTPYIRNVDYHNLATAEFRLNEREAARAWLEEGLRYYPLDGGLVTRLATAHVEDREFQKARAVLEAYVERRPDDPVALLELGDVMIRLGQPEKARTVLRHLLDIDPQNPQARAMLERVRQVRRPAETDGGQGTADAP